MGVHGLWQLLHSAGRPVSLESLEGKVLAVDVSIWLHQTMKGMRDKDGNPLPNAHLQGLFSRVCKLLFYRIKPVFVFDGGVPILKKQTMAARKERKAEAERESSEIAQKLLRNLVKSNAVKKALGETVAPKRVPGVRRGRDQESDIFQLAPLPESEEIGLAINAEEWERDFELQEAWIKESLSSLSDAQPDSEEFRSLPMEIQHEVLNELKERKKYHSLSKLIQMPEDSDSFSSYQLKKLMQQSKLTNRIEEVRKEMATKTAGDVSLGDDLYGDEVEARRIVSEDSSHYVLIKGLTKRKQEEEAEKFELYNKVKLEKIEEENDESEYNKRKMLPDERKQKQQIKVVSAGSDDSDVEIVMKKKFNRKLRKRKSSQKEVYKGSMKRRDEISETETIKTSSSFQAAAQLDEMDSSSEDEGFIEVTIDPTTVVEEDELFPASIFQTSSEPLTLPEVIPLKNRKTSDIQQPGNPPSLLRKEPNSTECAQPGGLDIIQKLASDETVVAKRKSVLNDILQQLEEKKKKLNETLQEVEGGGDSGDNVPDIITSGGFFREDSDEGEDEHSCPATGSGDAGLKTVHDGKAQTRKDSVPLSDSDEELQLAIEISLQTAVNSSHKANTNSDLTKENKESPVSSSVKSNIEDVRPSSNESKTKNYIQSITEELKSVLSETEESLNEKNISSSSDSEVSEEENLDGSKLSISPSKAVARPQPEDFEGEDEIETYFHNLNNDDLMEMNTDLDSERMALLMEQGKQNRLATSVTEQINMEAQELLRLFGIPYLVSPMEAEAQCAFLDITDQTQGTITDDSDIWLFGGRRMYKNFFNQSKHVELFTFDNIHKHFGLGREQLINIALLCGSDYTEGIQGVGPVRALEIMAEFPGDGFGGLCRFKQWWDKIKRQGIQTLENRTRDRLKDLKLLPGFPSKTVVDAYLNPTVDDSTERFTWRLPELDLLRDFAKRKFGWSKDKTDQSLLPMIKQLTKKDSQARISAFFHPDSFTPVSKIKSGRLKKALALVKSSQGKSGDGSVDHEDSDDTNTPVNVKSKSQNENRNAGRQEGIKSKVKSKSKTDEGKGTKRKLEAQKSLDINDQKSERDKSSILSVGQADSDDFMQAMAEKVKQASAALEKMKEKNQSCPPMKGSCTAKPRNKTVASLDRAKLKVKGKPRSATADKRPSVRAVVNLSESSSSDQSDDGSEKTKPPSAGHSNSVEKLKTPPKLPKDKASNLTNKNFHSSLSDEAQVKKSQGISKVSFEKTSKVSSQVVKGQAPQPILNQEDENSLKNKEIIPIALANSNLTSSNTDAVEVDIKKADVSIINKQNLPETLAYLNKRSREDKMLLHQLKGEHIKNAVEKRLEESEKRAAVEMLKPRPQEKDTDQVMSFEDLLGGMDTLTKAKKLTKTKKQTKDISKHSLKNNSRKVMDRANLDDFSFASLMGEDILEDVSPPKVSKNLKIQDKSDRNKDSFTVGNQSSKGSKSARAKSFDQPIAASDDEDDAYTRKLGTKEVFRRQMEHLTDTRSVRGHGILPLQFSGNASKGRAFAGKGKGRGKNRNQTGSAQIEESDDMAEYAMMTTEDLGSDFSDCDFT